MHWNYTAIKQTNKQTDEWIHFEKKKKTRTFKHIHSASRLHKNNKTQIKAASLHEAFIMNIHLLVSRVPYISFHWLFCTDRMAVPHFHWEKSFSQASACTFEYSERAACRWSVTDTFLTVYASVPWYIFLHTQQGKNRQNWDMQWIGDLG